MATTSVTSVSKTVEQIPATSSLAEPAFYISSTAALILLCILGILLVFFILRDRTNLQNEAEKQKAEADRMRAEYRNAVVTLYGTGPLSVPASQVPPDATLAQALQIYLNTLTTLRKEKQDLQNDYDTLVTRLRETTGMPAAVVSDILAQMTIRQDKLNEAVTRASFHEAVSGQYLALLKASNVNLAEIEAARQKGVGDHRQHLTDLLSSTAGYVNAGKELVDTLVTVRVAQVAPLAVAETKSLSEELEKSGNLLRKAVHLIDHGFEETAQFLHDSKDYGPVSDGMKDTLTNPPARKRGGRPANPNDPNQRQHRAPRRPPTPPAPTTPPQPAP